MRHSEAATIRQEDQRSGNRLGHSERIVGHPEVGPSPRGLPSGSRPAFIDPVADRLRPLLRFCHLKGSDQPFEAQLQTAWVSFRQQIRVTFAGPEGGSAKLVNDRSRALLPGQDGRFSGNPIVRKDRC